MYHIFICTTFKYNLNLPGEKQEDVGGVMDGVPAHHLRDPGSRLCTYNFLPFFEPGKPQLQLESKS